MSIPKHFLDISDFDATTLNGIIARSRAMKDARKGCPKGLRETDEPLKGRMLALIFERPSTRTRVSFEVGMRQLGGDTLVLTGSEMQLGRGETIADTARVLSRYVDAIMIRAAAHETVTELAAAASVPVINGLTNLTHPCQVMADVMTLEEHLAPLKDLTISWVGDGNNVAASWVQAVGRLGGRLRIGAPAELAPARGVMDWAKAAGADVSLTTSPEEAVAGADCVITDCWVSMHNTDSASRHNLLRPYQVNAKLMRLAKPNAKFMHCLPAHRGEEVTDEVIDSQNSLILDEAENRLHVQKAILLHCLGA
ncbi:MAG: ornithine carbamoyltransferase [Aestuariivirga sp.]|uniref:ornithine carbamoyltransferase n=1 Tax=Aestuariivirga sp. TaxID=2650926 RepID=UPI0025C35972|nr:ornithine carbamoyltransferase [Aestuariivirga sp.]MCA3559540.1 ornithine carbamoyltransferase [Aestuariivirga sp.]